jgi:isopenicillin N synthase-like dioxygenase
VSLIHYFPQDFENSLACDEHRDSGLLTAIVKTGVPSLQVWDKHHKKYLKIEEMVQDDEMIVFMGEKVPLFCATNVCLILLVVSPKKLLIGLTTP